MKRLLGVVLLGLWLSGCVTSPQPLHPRELPFAVPPSVALEAAADTLMARGYVIRHSDGELGRLEAVLARWPGYRVQVRVAPEPAGSRVSLTATHGGRPLPPQTLDPLLVEMQDRLGLLP